MNKDLKDVRLTEEEQDTAIANNQVNINEQIVLTDVNTTDIAIIKDYLSFGEGENIPATAEDINDLQDQLTANDGDIASLQAEDIEINTSIDNIEAKDVEQDSKLDILEEWKEENTGVDEQQNTRLEIIENALASKTSDYAIFTVDGTIDETGFTLINETVTKDFEVDSEVASFDPETGLVTVGFDSTVTNNFHFTASQLTGTLVEVTVSLINVTQGTTIDSSVIELDFSGATTVESGTRFNKGDVGAGDELDVTVKTAAGQEVTIISSALDYEVAVKQGKLEIIYDHQVLSTATLGNATTLLDINQLAEEADALEARVGINETDIAELETQVATNTGVIEGLTSDNSGKVDGIDGVTRLHPNFFTYETEDTGIYPMNFKSTFLQTTAKYGVDAINELKEQMDFSGGEVTNKVNGLDGAIDLNTGYFAKSEGNNIYPTNFNNTGLTTTAKKAADAINEINAKVLEMHYQYETD